MREPVWVTGAKGFIGRHLCRYLSNRGAEVLGIGHGAWAKGESALWGVKGWLEGDISSANLDALAAMGSSLPGRIYHLAGGSTVGASIAAPYVDFEKTVTSSARLLEWVYNHARSARLVTISSAAVYGSGHDGQITEETQLTPFSPYGFHKQAMELLCQSYAHNYALNISIVRLFSVYGPMLTKQLLWDMCGKLADTSSAIMLGGTGNELRDWTHVDDIVRLLDLAASQASPLAPIMNAGTGIGTSVRTIAETLVHAWGRPVTLAFSSLSRPGDPQSLIACPTRLNAMDFSWDMDLATGLATYVAWFKHYTGLAS